MSAQPAGHDADRRASAARRPAGLPARAVVDLDAIRDNVAALRRARRAGRGHGGGQGRRLRPRPAAQRPRGRCAAARPGSASPSSPRRWRCARPGSTAPLLSWLHVPGQDFAAARRAPTSTCRSPRPGRSTRSPRRPRAARPHRPRPPQGRHRPGPQRRLGRRLARPGRPRPRRREAEGAVARRRRLVATSPTPTRPQHPTVRPQQERFDEAVAQAERAGCRPAGAAPGQLRRHPDQPVAPTSTSSGPGSRSTACRRCPTSARPRTSGCAPAMTLRRRPGRWSSACPAGAGRLLRPRLHHRPQETTLGAGAAGLRRRRSRATPTNVGPVAGRRPARTPSPAGSAWTSSSSTSAPTATARGRRRGRALRRAARDGEPTAQDWAARPARSTTRSSPGSAPGCPGVYVGGRAVSSPRRRTWPGSGSASPPPVSAAAAGVAADRLTAPRRTARRSAAPSAYDVRARRGAASSSPTTACRCTSRSTSPAPTRRRPATASRPCVFSHGYSPQPAQLGLPAAGADRGRLPRRRSGTSAATAARDAAPRSRCTIDQLGRDLHRVIEEVAPEGPLVLVGHSMGGMTMMSLAEPPPRAGPRAGRRRGFIATSAGGLDEVSLGLRPRLGKVVAPRSARASLGRWRARQTLVTPRPRGRPRPRGLLRRALLASPRRCRRIGPAAPADMIFGTPLEVMADFLPTFDQPRQARGAGQFHGVEMLVLNGDAGPADPAGAQRGDRPADPRRRARVVKDAGHIIMLEHPEVVNEQLAGLVERGHAGPVRRASSVAPQAAGAPHRHRPGASSAGWPRLRARAAAVMTS